MVDPHIIKEWISKADEDFEFARINFEEEKPFYAQICFHFHQSAEKYLKTYIIEHRLDFRKIHDLSLLLQQCISKDGSFDQLIGDCEYLATFYIEARYPVQWPAQFTRKEAKKAYKAAKNIQSLVKKKLSSV